MKAEQIEGQLVEEQAIGNRAQQAYNLYLKEYIEVQNRIAYNRFIDSISDEDLINLKRNQNAIRGLEHDILQDIETGKLASIQLEEMRK